MRNPNLNLTARRRLKEAVGQETTNLSRERAQLAGKIAEAGQPDQQGFGQGLGRRLGRFAANPSAGLGISATKKDPAVRTNEILEQMLTVQKRTGVLN